MPGSSIHCLRSILAIGALALWLNSSHAETRDGYWWVQQDEPTKIYYVLGSIDRTMLTGSIDPHLKTRVIGSPQIGAIVAEVDRLYARQEGRTILVQEAIAVALYQMAQR